jgi:hypothetical protein
MVERHAISASDVVVGFRRCIFDSETIAAGAEIALALNSCGFGRSVDFELEDWKLNHQNCRALVLGICDMRYGVFQESRENLSGTRLGKLFPKHECLEPVRTRFGSIVRAFSGDSVHGAHNRDDRRADF